MPRKHLIASGINKKQQSQAKTLMRLAQEIKAAVKVAGPNPEANPRLKAAVDRALENNMTKDSIKRNIEGIQKDKNLIDEIDYEIFGPNGLGIIVTVITDNLNRSISSIRGYISKLKGNLAKSNSVKNNFEKKGIILIGKENCDEEKLLNLLGDFKIEDIISNDDGFEITMQPNDFYSQLDDIKNILTKENIKINQEIITYIPLEYVDLNQREHELLEKFLSSCENDDDVYNVITNFGEIKNE